MVVGRARRHRVARRRGPLRSPTSRVSIVTRSRAKPRSPRWARSATPTRCPVILDACRDKPAVRRRAVLALAPFDGPEVDAAIDAALADRDWQVRQAAEDLQRLRFLRATEAPSISSGSRNSSWSRLTCSVHSWPVQYRQWNRPVGSGYQSAGTTGAVSATPPRLTCSVHAVPSQYRWS